MEPSEAMLELREKLDAAGIGWVDASEDRRDPARGYAYHMERTRAVDGDGIEVASCIWGYVDHSGSVFGMTRGWPSLIECARLPLGANDPEPMDAGEIVAMVDAELRRPAPLRGPCR